MTLAIESRFRDAHLSVHLGNFAALTELSERASVIMIASWNQSHAGRQGKLKWCCVGVSPDAMCRWCSSMCQRHALPLAFRREGLETCTHSSVWDDGNE